MKKIIIRLPESVRFRGRATSLSAHRRRCPEVGAEPFRPSVALPPAVVNPGTCDRAAKDRAGRHVPDTALRRTPSPVLRRGLPS